MLKLGPSCTPATGCQRPSAMLLEPVIFSLLLPDVAFLMKKRSTPPFEAFSTFRDQPVAEAPLLLSLSTMAARGSLVFQPKTCTQASTVKGCVSVMLNAI